MKNRKKMTKGLLPVILSLLLASCGSAPAETVISVAYAGEELPDGQDYIAEFADYDSEYQVKVVFSANNAVEDFKFLVINFVDVNENGEMQFEIAEELYTLDKLPADRPLVIDMTFAGAVPDRGISYVDRDGRVKYYSIQMSGEDDSLFLTEFS